MIVQYPLGDSKSKACLESGPERAKMPKLNEYPGLAEFIVELKDVEKLPWESSPTSGKDNVRDRVRADERFTGAIKEKGSIIPLRDLYRQAKMADAEGTVTVSGRQVKKINVKTRGWKERVWDARRAGLGLTVLTYVTGLSMGDLKAVLKESPEGEEMLKRSYGLDENGNAKWSEGAAVIAKQRREAAEMEEADDDDEIDDLTDEAPAEPVKREGGQRRPKK